MSVRTRPIHPPESTLMSGSKLMIYPSTSRIRKVKCDEKKPECLRCINTGRKCDGYTPSSTSRSCFPTPAQKVQEGQSQTSKVAYVGGISRPRASIYRKASPNTLQPSIVQFDNVNQQEAFSFFVSCTTPMSSLYYGGGFWTQYVLKLGISVPAIRYALCALSELHRTFQIQHDSNDPSDPSEHRRNSIAQYGLAIKHTQDILQEVSGGRKDRLVEGLVLCVLFVCYENLIGHHNFAQMHLQNGLKILALELGSTTEASPSATAVHIPADVIGVFHRLDLQAMSFADATAPYPYGQYLGGIKTGPMLPGSDSIHEFTESLTNCFRWLFTMVNISNPEPISKDELDMAAKFLRSWDLQFKRVIHSYDEQEKASVWENIQVLGLYHALVAILVEVGVYGDEMLHDQHEATYRRMVQIGENILNHRQEALNRYIFTFEMGIILPLFYTALKCRNPSIRRNAIRLLSSGHHQEGLWESVAAGQIAEFVVEVEERSLDAKIGAGSIPPSARVRQLAAR